MNILCCQNGRSLTSLIQQFTNSFIVAFWNLHIFRYCPVKVNGFEESCFRELSTIKDAGVSGIGVS